MHMMPPTTALMTVQMVSLLMQVRGDVCRHAPKQPLSMAIPQQINALIDAQ